MIGVLITFQYDADFDRARVEKLAVEASPMFEGMPGLRSKVFTADEEQRRAINFYVWDDADAARAFFNDALRERVTGLYGTAPRIEFLDVVGLVDNARS